MIESSLIEGSPYRRYTVKMILCIFFGHFIADALQVSLRRKDDLKDKRWKIALSR